MLRTHSNSFLFLRRYLAQIPFGKLDHKACSDHGAVGLKPHRVIAACGDLDDVCPAADLKLPVAVISDGDHGAVVLKPHRVIHSCGDLGGVRPTVDIALQVIVISHGNHTAVGVKPYCLRF